MTAWDYMRDLWDNMVPASTSFDAMQEPLARGEVLVAWDHVARLVGAPASKPDDWLMVPAPRGPKGRGYMLIVAGLALPKGGMERERAEQVVRSLMEPAAQIETLRQQRLLPGDPDGTAHKSGRRHRAGGRSGPPPAEINRGPPGAAARRSGRKGRRSIADLQELLPGNLPQQFPRSASP